jgi:hypothetical protein
VSWRDFGFYLKSGTLKKHYERKKRGVNADFPDPLAAGLPANGAL